MTAVKELQKRLQKASNKKTRDWFNNYLKGAIEYRGVKTPQVAKILHKWRKDLALDQKSSREQLKLAVKLIEQKKAEDKFAGIIYIQDYLLKEIKPNVLLGEFEKLYKKKAFFDWSTTDWFCMRVLSPLITENSKQVAQRIASWKSSKNFWQRRSSIVAFVHAVQDKSFHSIAKATISKLVKEDERFIQTGIGWVIANMSRKHSKVAESIVEKHFKSLSIEVLRRHTKYLPKHKWYIKEKTLRN